MSYVNAFIATFLWTYPFLVKTLNSEVHVNESVDNNFINYYYYYYHFIIIFIIIIIQINSTDCGINLMTVAVAT